MSQIIAEYKFDNILYDLIPEFNEGFEYTYKDVLEGNVTTRTIYSNELPTLLRFGNSDTSGETGDSNKYNSLLEVLYLASSEITYAGLMFHRCANVSYICPFILTNKNNSLHGIFSGCHSLTSLDVSNFDTSNVTDMSYVFYTNNLIELDLSDWDTSNVTNMNHILYSCQNLKTLNISNWNLNNVDNMGWFVNQCNNLNEIIMNDSDYNSVNKIISELPITTNGNKCNFCIGGVDDISKVNIREGWDIINQYKIVQYKFNNTSELVPVFNEGFTYTYEDVIDDTTTIRTIYSTELPTKINFNGATRLLEISYLDSSNITDASNMFYGCTKLTNIVGIKDWDVRKITTMYMMFTSCTSLTELDLSNWEPSSLTTMYGMFYKCSKLTSIKLGKGNTPVLTSTEGMFNSCLELLNIDFGGLNVSNVNNMGGMFSDCRKLKSLNISHWDVSKVTNFGAIFRRCNSLLELNLSNWNLSSAENVSTMFESCASIVSLDLSDLVVENVRTLSGLFQSCSSLVTLNLSGWHLEKDVSITNLFNKCDKLMFVIMERSDAFTVNKFITSLPIRSENTKGRINIKYVDDFIDVNIKEAISKYWTVFRNQGCITNIHAGCESVVNKLLHDKKIKNIYLGNTKML
jgi:surface protein